MFITYSLVRWILSLPDLLFPTSQALHFYVVASHCCAYGKKQYEAKQPTTILPGWESPPTLGGKQKQPKLSFKNIKRLGGFLTGEANRFLKNAENAARKVAKKTGLRGTTIRSSRDEVFTGTPRAEAPVKTKKGYRTGKVKPLGEPVVTRLDETSHKRNLSLSNMEYMYGHTYRNADLKTEKGLHGEKMRDVEAYVKANPIAIGKFMVSERLTKMKKKNPERYRKEKAAAIAVAGGLAGWKGFTTGRRAYRTGKKLYEEFGAFRKGL